MSLVFNELGEVLVVQSAKGDVPGQGEWYFPQGGVKIYEAADVTTTIHRELQEELGIQETDMTLGKFLGSEAIDAPANRENKRGFSKGKKYFGFVVYYSGSGDLTLQENEIAEAKWVSPADAKNLMEGTRGEKRDMMFAMLDKAVALRSQANSTD